MRLDTQTLKDAAEKLWRNACAPTCGGNLITTDPYRACQEGAASGMSLIIGMPTTERMVYRSFIGDRHDQALIDRTMADIQKNVDDSVFDAGQTYIKTHASASDTAEIKAKRIEQWVDASAYRFAAKLTEGGKSGQSRRQDIRLLLQGRIRRSVNEKRTCRRALGAVQPRGGNHCHRQTV